MCEREKEKDPPPLLLSHLLTIFLQSNDSDSMWYDGVRGGREGRVKNRMTERGDEGEKGVGEREREGLGCSRGEREVSASHQY